MSDNNEKIIVEVDGSSAVDGFSRIKSAAEAADKALNDVAPAADNAQSAIDKLLGVGRRAAEGLKATADAAKQAADGIDKAGDSAAKNKSKFDELQSALFGGARKTGAFIWDIAADGFRMAMGFAESFIEHISSVQRTMSLLSAVPGTNIATQFEYLIGVANRYGLSLEQIQTNYARFVLSTQNSSMTTDQVQRSFEQIAMTVRTLHMNTQQATFTFLALEEMMSKGQVSMQQLNRQFAIRIPGAMEAIAREIGVTTPVLIEFITKVGAASDKMMPQITNALQRMFSGGIQNAAQALDAELNRIKSSITVFFKNVLDSGGDKGMAELLRTINSLLQTDSIASVFASAMNKITGQITMFLKTLKPDDIEKFASTALKFLESFATLAMAAGNAIVFMAKHIPEVGAAIGAFVGATALAPFGPWGAAIGLVGGGIAGYMGAKAASNGSGFSMSNPNEKLAENDAKIAELQEQIKNPTFFQSFGQKFDPTGINTPAALKKQIQQLQVENLSINATLGRVASTSFRDDENANRNLPYLAALRGMRTGTTAQQVKELQGEMGSKLGKKSAEERAAEHLATRQSSFLEEMLAKAKSIMTPEEDKFESTLSKATRPVSEGGLGMDPSRVVKDSDGHMYSIADLIKIMQDDYNKKKQDISDKKTQERESQFHGFNDQTTAEKLKFGETYDLTNLQQIDDQSWATKARKMGTELDKALIEQSKKMTDRARLSPLYAMDHPDIQGEIDAMRKQGDAYIEEFKRIEREKKTAMGGTKEFLKDWNDTATNMGDITKNFLKGTTDGIVNMLTDMVMTGHLSFAKLTQFVLEYITKMLIVQSITPFMNTFAGALSTGLSNILNIGTTAMPAMNNISAYQARATGGPVWSGEPFLVGERGPEVVTFDRPGYVHPNESLRGNGGNTSVQVNVDATGQSSNAGNAGMGNLGRKIADAVRMVIVDEKRPGGMLS